MTAILIFFVAGVIYELWQIRKENKLMANTPISSPEKTPQLKLFEPEQLTVV